MGVELKDGADSQVVIKEVEPMLEPVGNKEAVVNLEQFEMTQETTTSQNNPALRKDMLNLESLAIPGDITSATWTNLSLFSYDADAEKFHLLDHKRIFRQVSTIHTVPQQHSLDCLLVVSINGEWLFLQWHENDFFPLASGSFMDAVVKITKTPQQRRFRINPTYQFSVLVIPQEENQCTHISKPNITSPSKKPLNSDPQSTFDEVSCLLNDNLNATERISFRAVCFVDETVLIGLQYDGLGSILMYDISEKMDETLLNIPQ
ncbi:MAG: hypothetical protein EZS28_032175, partial [Streblomastix strix]